jgi:hypothetical protein
MLWEQVGVGRLLPKCAATRRRVKMGMDLGADALLTSGPWRSLLALFSLLVSSFLAKGGDLGLEVEDPFDAR